MQFDKNFLNKKILICSDYDSSYTQDEIEHEKKYLNKLFDEIKEYKVEVEYKEVKNEDELKKLLSSYDKNDWIIFNWCERFDETDGTEKQVTKIYEELGFIYAGASTKSLTLLSNKIECVKTLLDKGISVPESYYINKDNYKNLELEFSKGYIVKSNSIHASLGITHENFVDSKDKYTKVVENYLFNLNSDVIVQKYINGEEYTVVVWGNQNATALLPIKLNFEDEAKTHIFTNAAKSNQEHEDYQNQYYTFLNESHPLTKTLQKVAKEAFEQLQIEDYARIDILVEKDKAYVIDINGNPYMNVLDSEETSEVYNSTKQIGYNWGETVLQICEFAYKRSIK